MISNFSIRHRTPGRFFAPFKIWFYLMQSIFVQYFMVLVTIPFFISLVMGLYEAWGELDKVILNGYFVCMFFNSQVNVKSLINYYCLIFFIQTRGFIRVWKGKQFERFSENLEVEYNKIAAKKDPEIQKFIKAHTAEANFLHNFNWIFGHFLDICFLSYPFFASQRELPFKMFVPFINELEAPTYQILYVYQIILTFFGCWTYVPITTFFTTGSIFALLQMKTLQNTLKNVINEGDSNEVIDLKLNDCVEAHKNIIVIVKELNDFVSFICLTELLCFGIILAGLLILLNFVRYCKDTLDMLTFSS